MKNINPRYSSNLNNFKLFFHLIPVIGFFPSLWTLYRYQGKEQRHKEEEINEEFIFPKPSIEREQLAISRLSVTLASSWLLGYLLLSIGAETSEFLTLRLLILNSLLTSGYFLVSFWLILRLWQGKSARLPGFSRLAERMLDK